MFDNLISSLFSSGERSGPTDRQNTAPDAASDLSVLIKVAARLDVEISKEDLQILIFVQSKGDIGTLPVETQVQFWSAYERVLGTLEPVNIDSINAIFKPVKPAFYNIFEWFRQPSRTLAEQSVSKYKRITSLTLLLIIIFQAYWFSGSSLVNDIHTQNLLIGNDVKQLGTIQQQLYDDQALLENFNKSNNGGGAINQPLNSKIEKLKKQIADQKSQIEQHKQWKEATTLHLSDWNKTWSKNLFFFNPPWQDENYRNLAQSARDRTQFVSAKFALKALSDYLLPLLYGLLGTCFFILRKLPEEIEKFTFSRNSCSSYSLRLSQGSLAGIICGFFLATNPGDFSTAPALSEAANPGVLANLSPLAIAFLAGYSVDTFLRVMDHMISLVASISSGTMQKAQYSKAGLTASKRPSATPSSAAAPPTSTPAPAPASTSRTKSDDTD